MGQIKRLSVNDVRRITGVSAKQCKKVTWHTSNLTIRRIITPSEYIDTIDHIVQDCVSNDGKIATDFLDFAFRVNIISTYAYVELPNDLSELHLIIYASDLFETIYKYASSSQIDSILSSARMRLLMCGGYHE